MPSRHQHFGEGPVNLHLPTHNRRSLASQSRMFHLLEETSEEFKTYSSLVLQKNEFPGSFCRPNKVAVVYMDE